MLKITFIISSYNYSQYIGKTIESVENQTFQDWEMLVIDDGSKDNSIDIINGYVQKDNRIRLITHPNNDNRGLIETLKLGISQAQGEYIVFLESDDYIREDYLEKKLSIFEQYSDVGLVYNKVKMFGEDIPKKYTNWINRINNYWNKHNYPHNIYQQFGLQNFIPTFSCVMIKKDLLKVLDWKSPNPASIDIWLWMQISKKCDMYYCPEELTFWRIHNSSYINSARMTPQNGYLFHKKMFMLNIIEPRRLDYKLKNFFRELIIIIIYKYWCIKQNTEKQIVKNDVT